MLDWNGPHCASGLLLISVCCLCTSLVLHLGCVSLERHVNAECPVQTKLSFFAGMAASTTAPSCILCGGSAGAYQPRLMFKASAAPVQRLLCNVRSSLDTVHLALLCSCSYQRPNEGRSRVVFKCRAELESGNSDCFTL